MPEKELQSYQEEDLVFKKLGGIFMKNFLSTLILSAIIILASVQDVSAENVWCYSYSQYDYYIDTDKIYDNRPNYFVYVIVVNSSTGNLATKQFWNFSKDEGVLWYSSGQENGRVSESEVATAVFNKMRENIHLAKHGSPR